MSASFCSKARDDRRLGEIFRDEDVADATALLHAGVQTELPGTGAEGSTTSG